MGFNIGLSGLRAASTDLDVTGNNIANASTVGFKGSRAQFGDLYANGFLSSGSNTVGDGVRVQDIQQSFGQGNISFTNNGMDMAINGDGFFVMNNGGEVSYSRAGQFGVDKNGYVVNNQGARVQGFQADGEGNVSGVRDDLFINRDNLSPRRTSGVESELNLDGREGVLEVNVSRITTNQLDPSEAASLNPDPKTEGGFGEQQLTVTYPGGTTNEITIPAGSSASAIADKLSQEEGVSASARSKAILNGDNIQAGDVLKLQGTDFKIRAKDDDGNELTSKKAQLDQLADDINGSALSSLNAVINENGDLRIISSRGDTLQFNYDDKDGGTGISLVTEDDPPVNVATIPGIASKPLTQTGKLELTLDRDTTIKPTDPMDTGTILKNAPPKAITTNSFDPSDQSTYNHATSNTVYDSLGNPHVMTQYFVKEPATGVNQGSPWSLYVQIDGKNVGDPPDSKGNPTQARYDLLFNDSGQLQSVNGQPDGKVLVSNWSPTDPDGKPNGADGPRRIANGAQTPIPDPPISSNFTIDLSKTTQFGSGFAVDDQRQNGYTTGRLSGLDVSSEGVLFARYTNGQSQTLGQVALANFNSTDGLAPRGDTAWVETFESGQPVIGKPGSEVGS